MADTTPIRLEKVSHHYGSGKLRKQILFDVDISVRGGEIVILTGPSGSGKTTLLTLIGALRAAQDGSVRVLDHELRGASERALVQVRRRIGYIFQQHNLIDALTVRQNVQMAIALGGPEARERGKERIREVLEQVGLGEHLDTPPSRLSGGQKQRVGIARALVNRPRIILADEPTASLDKKSGRDVVQLIWRLSREEGATVILVTHDNRILDVADRILHLEDGRIQSLSEAVAGETSRMLHLLERRDPDAFDYLATFSLALARVASADSIVHDDERIEMQRILSESANLGPAEIDLVMELAVAQARGGPGLAGGSPRSALDPQRRQHVVDSMYAIARADGRVTEDERREIDRIVVELFGNTPATPATAPGPAAAG